MMPLETSIHEGFSWSDGALIPVDELGERLGYTELIEQHLTDSRGKNTQTPLADLFG